MKTIRKRSHLGTKRIRSTRDRQLRLEGLEPRQLLDAAGLADDTPGLAFSRFESAEELSQFLLDDAVKRYDGLFGQPAWWWGPYDYLGGPVIALAGDGGEARNYSETNTQVAGVDEADIVETDGEYLFVLGQRDVVIIDASPADGMSVASRVAIDGQPFGEILHGDRLAVLSYLTPAYDIYPMIDTVVARPAIWPGPYGGYQPQVQVTLIDVSNRAAPRIVTETRFDGSFVDARAIGDTLYVVSNDSLGLPTPEITCTPIENPDDPNVPADNDPADRVANPGDGVAIDALIAPIWYWPQENCVYESKEDYLARVVGHEIELGLPQMTSDPGGDIDAAMSVTGTTAGTTAGTTTGGSTGGSTGSTATDIPSIGGPLTQPTDVYRPTSDDQQNLVSITTFDLSSNLPGVAASTSVPTTATTEVYASHASIYLANPDWGTRWDQGYATSILKFDFQDNGGVDLVAGGHVPGQTLDQFSIDEHDGYLRIATTQGWGNGAVNSVYVLAQSGERLSVVGSLVGLAPGERIFAARFMGDEGYVVTFRQTDPLFALDLSDPTAPKVVGELHIPGFSNYLQAADDTHLIGIGRNADLNGRAQELQVSLFDVADMSNPQLAGRYGIEVGNWSWSEATTDHHAVGFYAGYDVLAIPVTNGGGWEWIDRDGDGTQEFYSYRPRTDLWVFHLNLNPTFAPVSAIELLGRIQHDGTIRRSVRIGDVLYAISENTVTAHPILNPSTMIGRVHFGQEPVGVPLMRAPDDDPVISLAMQSPEIAAPVVATAVAGGSTWSPGVINYLESNGPNGAGSTTTDGGSGGSLTTPSTLGWSNVNQIKLTFNEDVAVGQSDLTVTGVNVEQYGVSGFAYDADSRTAVWTLDRSLPADHVTVTLSDGVTDMSGNRLDGNHDGVAGGQFKFTFSSLPGDVNADGSVDSTDLYETIRQNFQFVGSTSFSLAADVDGDGRVTVRDAIAVRNRLGTNLAPLTPPAAIVVTVPGDGVTRRVSRRANAAAGGQREPVAGELTATARVRTVVRGDSLAANAVDRALGEGSAFDAASPSARRSALRRLARSY
ncbi:MAG: beta-propeller domain-containing protein [Pirellulales bacterium]